MQQTAMVLQWSKRLQCFTRVPAMFICLCDIFSCAVPRRAGLTLGTFQGCGAPARDELAGKAALVPRVRVSALVGAVTRFSSACSSRSSRSATYEQDTVGHGKFCAYSRRLSNK